VVYVKADAVALPAAVGAPDLARFELHVRDVIADRAQGEEAGADLVSGITFRLPGGAARWTERSARVRRALAE
jgi:hypothetical protein